MLSITFGWRSSTTMGIPQMMRQTSRWLRVGSCEIGLAPPAPRVSRLMATPVTTKRLAMMIYFFHDHRRNHIVDRRKFCNLVFPHTFLVDAKT
mmetsp:Transcript_94738/g.148186  ORF Transcript_94738/g.148186 Transcript_94738/m.148186 type:complete len:93 (-) Transcript_94738:261-539(-)